MAQFKFSGATARSVISAFGKAAKVEQSAKETRNQAGQKLVDELTIACDMADKAKFFDKVKARAACIEVFQSCPGLSESSVKNYPMSVKLAFVHNVPFEASLFTKEGKEKAGIATPSAGTATPKAGKVEKTDLEAASKTFQKALSQLRTLGLDDVAADVLDTLQGHWSWFSETPAK